MPWTWVYGQERVVDILRRSVGAGRVAHAYLFHGPEGTGKRVAALALAQTLQCERRTEGTGDACGECGPCSKVARMIHPDVQVHLAQPKNTDQGDVNARVGMLAEDPYAEVSYRRLPDVNDPEKSANKQAFYDIERFRDLLAPLRYTPAEGRHKVAIFTDADTMRTEAANTFLKILEEPNPQTVLILTATRPDRLLPTIISRCQRLRFESVPAPEIERALAQRGLAGAEIPLIARMAGGSVTQAIGLASDQALAERRGQVVDFLRHSYSPSSDETLDEILKALAGIGREPLRDALTLMLTWLRDVVVTRASNGEMDVVNVDQRQAIARFVSTLPEARLDDMVALVEHAVELTRTNVSVTLILLNLSDGLREAMRGRPRRRLFAPLAG